MNTSSTMVETRATAILNETIATLKSTTDHHNKDIQEIHKITSIHTRTLNEMSQQLATILQKLNAPESVDHNHENPYRPEDRDCHQSVLGFSKPVKLDFPRFSGKEGTYLLDLQGQPVFQILQNFRIGEVDNGIFSYGR